MPGTVSSPSQLSPVVTPGGLLHRRYRVIRPLAAGGEGTTWLAADEFRSQSKVVFKRLESSSARAHITLLERLSTWQHPHLGLPREMLDAGDGAFWVVTDYFADGDLSPWVRSRRPQDVVLRCVFDLLRGLRFLHDNGLVHGDIKPENIVVDSLGNARWIDFGFVSEWAAATETIGGTDDLDLHGTPAYLAPERVFGRPPSPQSDLYALGITVFQLLTGGFPFDDDIVGRLELLASGRDSIRLTKLSESPDLTGWLPWVRSLLAFSPEKRPQSVHAAAQQLVSLFPSSPFPVETRESIAARIVVSGFMGRETVTAPLESLFHSASVPVAYWVAGQQGSGRSSWLEAARRAAALAGFDAPESFGALTHTALVAWFGGETESTHMSVAAVADSLLARSADRPLWLTFDDAEAATADAKTLVVQLVRLKDLHPRSRLMLSIASLPLDQSNDARELHGMISPFCRITEINLPRLNEKQIGQLTARLSPMVPVPPSLVRDLTVRSGGEPVLLHVLLRTLVNADRTPLSTGEPLPLGLYDVVAEVPTDIQHAAAALLRSAPIGVQQVTRVLGVLGESIHREDLHLLLTYLWPDQNVVAAIRDAAGLGAVLPMQTPRGEEWTTAGIALATAALALEPQSETNHLVEQLVTFMVKDNGEPPTMGMGERYPRAVVHALESAHRYGEAVVWAFGHGLWADVVRNGVCALKHPLADDMLFQVLEAMAMAYATRGEFAAAGKMGERLQEVALANPARAATIRLRLCEIELDAGRPQDAAKQLDEWISRSTEGADRNWAQALLARARLTMGELDAAEKEASEVVEKTPHDDSAGFHARVTLALTRLYRGHTDAALADLQRCVTWTGEAGGRRQDEPFVLNAVGIAHQRNNDPVAAAQAYQASLASARSQGNLARQGIAAMNLGTVAQETGDLGQALKSYGDAEVVARRTGDDTALVKSLMNQANLYNQVGDGGGAQSRLGLAMRLPPAKTNTFLSAYLQLLSGEAAFRLEDPDLALRHLDEAYAAFVTLKSAREAAECLLLRARVLLWHRRFGELAVSLTALEQAMGELGIARLRVWWLWIRAEAEIQRQGGGLSLAADLLQRAKELSEERIRPEDKWRVHLSLARLLALTLPEEATTHADMAMRLLRGLADRLDEPLRGTFLLLPEHRLAMQWAQILTMERRSNQGQQQLAFRVLELNKRLSAETDPVRLLDRILDTAIAVTGAERGFILTPVGGTDELEVRVARNFDRESLKKKESKVSRHIARDVFVTGLPLLSVDAQDDDRLRGLRSVAAIRLRSVLCVPMRQGGVPMGVIHVDNRFQKGAFTEEQRMFMEAFADQAAVVLAWAETLDREHKARAALEKKRDELELARAQVAALNETLAKKLDDQGLELELTKRRLVQDQALVPTEARYGSMVGTSEALAKVFTLVDRVKKTAVPVVVTGESGTGKELVARELHEGSARKDKRFLTINCAALPETLLESELFGYEKGAFTGAERARAGLFEDAHEGTLFLDEVGDMGLSMQVKLLRVLESGEVRRVGSTEVKHVDVRIVAATHRDLKTRVAEREFREDLYFRLCVVEIRLPPLRERVEDIPLLADFILEKIANRHGVEKKRLGPQALNMLKKYRWPGNIRELAAVLTAAVLLTDGPTIDGAALLDSNPALSAVGERDLAQKFRWDGKATLEEITNAVLVDALERNGNNKVATARALGIDRNTLHLKLKRLNLK
ncbi:MAG: sigma 54-interacting transcriptional regulator [Myxococcales bacterium]|nr:sigma 54-interacting transcriptional regulator [Myxococcales bacterium]